MDYSQRQANFYPAAPAAIFFFALFAILLSFSVPSRLWAAERVEVSAQIVPQADGGRAELQITAQVQPGWHIYSITQKPGGPKPTRINLLASDRYRILGKFVVAPPATIHHYDFWPDLDVEEHEGAVTWSAPVEPTGPNGWQGVTVSGDVQGQVCKDLCVNFSQAFEATNSSELPTPSQLSAPNDPTVGAFAKVSAESTTATSFTTSHATMTGELVPARVEPGGRAKLILTANVADGWHLYAYEKRVPDDPMRARPTLIVLDQRDGLLAGTPRASTTVVSKAREQFPEYVDNYHKKDVNWTIDLEIPKNARSGSHVLSGWIGFMACNDDGTLCDPPKGARFEVPMDVGEESTSGKAITFSPASYSAATAAAANAPPWDVVIPQAAEWTWATLLTNMYWALLAGMLLNVMPCVLPVIGLKAMSFIQQASENRSRIFFLNLAFSAGILVVFLILAVLAAFADLAWAEQFQDSRFGIAMAGLVFMFALSLLGVWEIPIPGFIGSSTAQATAEREGLSGAFFKGVLTTLLATPCAGPFMITGLTFAAEQHSPIITVVIFGAMGMGMALPFLLIGANPALIQFLPKPGPWMETFKHLMGFVLLGTVVWIFSAFVPEGYFVASLGLLFGLWLACWWANRTPMTAALSDRLFAWIVASVIAVFFGYASFALLGEPILDGSTASVPKNVGSDPHQGEWEAFSPEKLDRFRAQGSTVLLDFTADG